MKIYLIYINILRDLCKDENIAVTQHANNRLRERNITIEDIKNAINTGEIIKQYEDDKPFPSCLILGRSNNESYIHVVVSCFEDILYIITSYYPDRDCWTYDFKLKKE